MFIDKPILVLDFDGVLHSYKSGWKGANVIPDPPVEGAIEFLYATLKHFEVHILSSRSHQEGGIDAMREWIKMYDEKWQREIGQRPELSLVDALHFPLDKPPAHVTLDDRGWQFNGKFPAVQDLLNFKPWYKR